MCVSLYKSCEQRAAVLRERSDSGSIQWKNTFIPSVI